MHEDTLGLYFRKMKQYNFMEWAWDFESFLNLYPNSTLWCEVISQNFPITLVLLSRVAVALSWKRWTQGTSSGICHRQTFVSMRNSEQYFHSKSTLAAWLTEIRPCSPQNHAASRVPQLLWTQKSRSYSELLNNTDEMSLIKKPICFRFH